MTITAFRCNEPNCGRLFTRHDNLLQHLKNNRHLSFHEADCRPLERVRPTSQDLESAPSDSPLTSPSMGILMPPSSPTTTLSYSQIPMNDLDSASAFEVASPASCGEVSSPESTPAPCEPCDEPVEQYQPRMSWQPSNGYAIPQYHYAPPMQSPQPHPQALTSTGLPLGIFGYQ